MLLLLLLLLLLLHMIMWMMRLIIMLLLLILLSLWWLLILVRDWRFPSNSLLVIFFVRRHTWRYHVLGMALLLLVAFEATRRLFVVVSVSSCFVVMIIR